MGISEGSDGGGIGVDCSVGTIVWVRRRNGSWWPGRILGPEELSASHLMSPRSGTPVKLLGREDASVDWYNLEKSKRVKAFRCGEFDACIERAEASQGIPIKKREKYARREDAILHALELEKQQLDIRHQRSGAISNGISNKTLGSHKREFNTFSSSDIYMRNDEEGVHSKLANKKSQMFPRKTSLLHEEESIGNSLYINKGKLGKQSVWEEDNPEAIPRMRGLQDFGLRIAPSKRKLAQTVPWETSRKSLDNHVDVLSAGNVVGSANLPGSSKNSLAIKRKRSQSGPPEESLSKKRDRRRPLVQVLQSSAKLPPSHSFQSDYDSALMRGERDHVGIISQAKRSSYVHLPADSNDSQDQSGYPYEQMPITTSQIRMSNSLDHTGPLAEEYTSSGLVEANMSDSSETDYSEPDMEEEDNSLTDTTQTLVPGSDDCDPSMFEVAEDFGDLNHDEMPRPGYLLQVHPNEQATDVSAEVGVSKWHMKGKRNIRNLAKKPMDLTDGKITFSSNCNGSIKGTAHGSRGSTFKSTRVEPSGQRTLGRGIYHKKETSHYAFDGGDFDLDDRQTMGYRNHRSPFPLKVGKDSGINHNSFNDSDDDSHVLSPSGWEANDSSPVQAEYWEGSDQCFGPIYSGRLSDELEPSLVDVSLKVQASYQGEHVPLVSLMSRLNGKAIIGHPVQVEILEDGSSGYLVPKYGVGLDESMAPPSVWRTARRTAKQRVPRSNPAASALDAEGAEPLHYSDLESKPPVKKAFSGYSNLQGKLSKKSSCHAQRASGSGKFQKKLLKRASLSSQKTRTLSSLATEQKRRGESGDVKHPRDNDILGGLIKPEGGVPLVTCVPVKVVFSRILEAVGRPSSAVAHRARMSSPTIRGPS